MFADLQNGRQNQGTGTRVVKGSNQLGQDFVFANLWRNLIQFFCQTGEKSEIIKLKFQLHQSLKSQGTEGTDWSGILGWYAWFLLKVSTNLSIIFVGKCESQTQRST